jgi:serine/threonine-protein kinase
MGVELPAGSVIGGFRIEALLGRGAMGEVYRATDGDRVVALKLLDTGLAEDDRFRQRFLRESQTAASLHHRHIVKTIDSGEDDGTLYLAMELIDGPDLRQVLRNEGRLEPERAVELANQVADALDAAHRAGLVHRDVKPGNILIEDEQAYVCDFGLARHAASVSSLTGDRGFVGTIDYVPPEQIEGGTIDGRADLYSLGCVLYECLAGARPFEGDSELAVVFAHLNEPPPRVTEVRPELPAAFDEVFATALAKSPDDRYSSCGELAAAARAALLGEVLAPRTPRRLRVLVAAAALAAVAVATAAVFVLRGGGHSKLPVTITQTSIGGAKLGDSIVSLQRLWNGGGRLSTQFPPDYSLLTQNSSDLTAFFAGTTDKAVELITWNASDRTDAGVGPCSSLAALRRAYGSRLKAVPNNHGYGYTVGKHIFFAIGTPPTPRFVSAVAVYSDRVNYAGYNALSAGPCTGPAPVSAPTTSTPAAPGSTIRLVQTIASRRFQPPITVRTPAGWTVRLDNAHAFALKSPNGPQAVAEQLAFFLDPFASSGDGPQHPGGAPLTGVSRTPTGLVTWLQGNPAVVATRPGTVKIGSPVLTARTVDIDLSAKAPKEDPGCPSACLSYLAFRGPGYRFPYGTGKGEPARLYFTSFRIGTEVHTLAIALDSPTRKSFDDVLPVATAIVKSLRVKGVVAVTELSALGSFCSGPFGGTCLGELTAGRHSTSSLQPKLTYSVPVGWTNFQDHKGFLAFVPPGGDWQAVDHDLSDSLWVLPRIASANGRCADGHGAERTPEAIVRWLHGQPGFAPFTPREVTIGGLSGLVVDLRIRKGFTVPCRWSDGRPAQQVLSGLPPAPDNLVAALQRRSTVMRLYLLHYKGGTLAVEIYEVAGDSKLAAYSAVVDSFRFG